MIEINCFQSLLSTKSTKLQDCHNGEVPLKSKNTLFSEGGNQNVCYSIKWDPSMQSRGNMEFLTVRSKAYRLNHYSSRILTQLTSVRLNGLGRLHCQLPAPHAVVDPFHVPKACLNLRFKMSSLKMAKEVETCS